MHLVTVKNKYQVVIPRHVREEIGVAIGDVMEAKVERGKIVFQPKSVVDRGIAESIAEFKAGRSSGPFQTRAEFLDALHKQAKRSAARKPKRRSQR